MIISSLPTRFSRHKVRQLLGILLLALPAAAGAAIYKSVASDGHVVYSDEPQPGATEVKVVPSAALPAAAPITSGPAALPVVPVVPSIPPASPTPDSAPATTLLPGQPIAAAFTGYSKFAILQPADNSTVRSNNGDVEVELGLEPELYAFGGHRIALLLDGKLILAGQTTPRIVLPNLDRGTHLLQAEVIDASGEVLGTAEGVTFTLQRFSASSADAGVLLIVPSVPRAPGAGPLIFPRAPR